MQAVIIAGGKGTRLRPLTYGCPKPMLPLLGRPFLVWMVERCREAGVTDILLNVQYQAHQVSDYFGDGKNHGVDIRYIEEEVPLDTAGAMKLAEPYFTGESLLVFNADILTDLDLKALIQFHKASGAQATLTLARVEDPTAFGLVELSPEQRVLAFREKPSAEEAAALGIDTINAGTYVLEPEIFAPYPAGQPLSFEKQVFPELLARSGKMMGFTWEGYWMDLGTPAKFYQAQLDILTGQMPYNLAANAQAHATGVWIANSAEVNPAAKLEAPCYVGDQAKLGANAHLPPGTLVGPQSLIDRPLSPGVYASGTLAV